MRLFTAVAFDDPVLSALSRVADSARLAGVSGRFTKREHLHLTLCFLGEVPVSRFGDLSQAVFRSVQGRNPFDLIFSELGLFSRTGGDILWVGSSPSPELLNLQSSLSGSLIDSGFLLERRAFTPHITLARNVTLPDSKSLSHIAPNLSIPLPVQAVTIFESCLVNGRLGYNPLQTVIF